MYENDVMKRQRWLRILLAAVAFLLVTTILWGSLSFETYAANAVAQTLSMLAVCLSQARSHAKMF